MKRSSSADRANSRTRRDSSSIQPFNNVLPARARSASLGLDVRCGCQFFGTDSLLPERQALMQIGRPKLGRPASMNSPKLHTKNIQNKNVKPTKSFSSDCGDHEYEVVMPPPTVRITSPNYDSFEPELGNAPRRGSASSNDSRERKERKYLNRPLDDELVGLPHDGEGSEDDALGVEEKELPERATSQATTTGSRTDIELHTSQIDSSALEGLPLSREARRQQRIEQNAEERGPGAAARSLQRIRSEAGKLRTKLRNIKRPQINMPERPKFSLPERPKFKFPERPKFNLPERPKFNLPDRSKFKLPDRPKFNRPKFNLPDRPKFHLPDRPKINFPSLSLPRTLRDRQQSTSSDPPVHIDTPAPVTTTGKRNYFDFRTYPRIFDRKKRQSSLTSRPKPRPITPPEVLRYDDDEGMDMDMDGDDSENIKPNLPPRRRSAENQNRWVGRFTELEYADAEVRTNGAPVPFDDELEDEEMKALERELRAGETEEDEEQSESLSAFKDKDFGYAVVLGNRVLPPPPPKMSEPYDEDESYQDSERDVAHSSGSSSDRRRAADAIEDIDSDEFFLREKGLSQEDVGRFLTNEVHETLSPDNNSSILETVDEDELARSYRGTPERNVNKRPPRRKPKPTVSPPRIDVEDIDVLEIDVQEIEEPEIAEIPVTSYFNTFPPNKPTRDRKRKMKKQRKEFTASTMDRPQNIPTPPTRNKKHTRSEFALDNESQWSDEVNADWIKTVESQEVTTKIASEVMVGVIRTDPIEHEYIIPPPPTAPKRERRAMANKDEDARSQVSEPGYATVVKPPVMVEINISDRHSVITDSLPPTPPRAAPPRKYKTLPKPPFPSIRRRRHRPLSGCGAPHFFTVPHKHKPPARPQRNYATLGPARPPRKLRSTFSVDNMNEANRNLQSGEVIQKMKERPLPPPPRPSRKDKSGDKASSEGPDESIEDVMDNIEHVNELNNDWTERIIHDEETSVQRIELSPVRDIFHVQQEIIADSYSPEPAEHVDQQTPVSHEEKEIIEETGQVSMPVQEITRHSEENKQEETPVNEIIIVDETQIEEEKIEQVTVEKSEAISSDLHAQVTQCIEPAIIERESEVIVNEPYHSEHEPPIEEISVSCQTDPIPEEELLRLEMEQEESLCHPVSTDAGSSTSHQPGPQLFDMNATAAAILQALNSGQIKLEILDVGTLNVSEVQASRLSVSDVESTSLHVNEFQTDSGSIVLNSLDAQAPINSIAEAIISAAQNITIQSQQAHTVYTSQPPIYTPPPTETTSTQCDPEPKTTETSTKSLQTTASIDDTEPVTQDTQFVRRRSSATIPTNLYQGLSPLFTTEQVLALQSAVLNNPTLTRENILPFQPRISDPDVFYPANQHPHYQEASIIELGSRFARACYSAVLAAVRSVVHYTENAAANVQTSERRSLQVALCLVLMIVAGIIFMGISSPDSLIHHHHWDFYMPK